MIERCRNDYICRRRELYESLTREGVFTWDRMYDAEYAVASFLTVSVQDREELRQATEELGRIFFRTAEVVRRGSDMLLEEIGLPEACWGAVRSRQVLPWPSVIGRFDFVKTAGGWKILEYNADTPGGVVEGFYVNQRACEYFGRLNPNQGMDRDLRQAFQQAFQAYVSAGYPLKHVVFSALDWHEEDRGTAVFLLEQSALQGAFIPLKDLRITEGQMVEWGDKEPHDSIDFWYRLHPLGLLAEDQDEDGYPTGRDVLSLMEKGRLATVNPPQALICQTKGLQALIWELHETGEFYSKEEHNCIRRYMLPTYMENVFCGHTPYVAKPVLGREGSGVIFFDEEGEEIFRDSGQEYDGQKKVYQACADWDPVTIETEQGFFSGYPVWGSFLIGGKGSAVTVRVGGKITGDMAFYVPIGME